MSHPTLLMILVCWLAAASASAQPLSQADLLKRMVDLDRLTVAPAAGETSALFSSWDRRQQTVEQGRYSQWAADNDAGQFIRQDADGWDVWMDQAGPGVITRIWTTKPTGRVQVVIDGRAVVECTLEDLFNGATAPLGEPFSYVVAPSGAAVSCFPMGFSRSCVIRSKDFSGAYQVDCSLLAQGMQVAPFSTELDEAGLEALRETAAVLRDGLSERQVVGSRRVMPVSNQDELAAGASLVEEFNEPGTVRALYVALTDRREPREAWALRQVLIRITFDGAAEPAVEAPLCDFFGAGFERSPVAGLALGTDRWTNMPGVHPTESWFMYCFFPMPFAREMKLELVNLSGQPIGLMYYLRIERGAPPADRLRFHARYRREPSSRNFDYPLVETTGPGRIVGCVLNVDSPRLGWWGAGDHKVWIDGGTFPAMLGTGTPDYFGAARPLSVFRRPHHGVSMTGPFGRQSLWRLHLLDSVCFQKSAKLAIENLQPGDAVDADYSSVAFWYAPADARLSGFKRLTRDDLVPAPFRIAEAIELEGNVDLPGSNVLKERGAGVDLSSQAALSVATDQPFPARLRAPKAGRYRLQLRVHPRRPFERIEITRPDGAAVGEAVYRQGSNGLYDVGELELPDGETVLHVRCTRPAVLDCWLLIPIE